MSKSTAVDFAPVTNSDVSMDKKELDEHIIRLMLQEPFYAAVLRGVNYVMTERVPTAGVSTESGNITMYWNPKFLASLTRDQVIGLLKHESMHLALNHTTDRKQEPHLIHNYATDLAINSDIPKEELPEGGLIPGEAFAKLNPEQLSKMSADQIDRYNRISEKIASFPKHQSSEWYFREMLEDEQMREDLENSEDLDLSMDDHGEWGDDVSDEDANLAKAKIRKVVENAAKECDSSGRWGSVSSETRKTIRQILSTEVDWRSVLKKFCGFSRRGTRSTSWSRINKKYAGASPGAKRGYTSSIAVYIDQSGSVCDRDLELVFAELSSLSKRSSFTTFHFDSSVDENSETVWKKGRRINAHRTKCGGTDFSAVTEHANKNAGRFDGYLIITDGEASKPGASKMKRGWLIVPNRNLIFQPSRRDFVMKMKEAS